MTLSELVPSLDLCQQLRDKGFPQDTALVWWFCPSCVPATQYQVQTPLCEFYAPAEILCAAPTAEEILKELPIAKNRMDRMRLFAPCNGELGWVLQAYPDNGDVLEEDPSLVQVVALVYLWWKEQK